MGALAGLHKARLMTPHNGHYSNRNTRITLYGVNALRQSPGLEWRRGLRLYPARCTSVEVPMTQRCLADHPASEGLGAIRALRALHRPVLGSEESKR